ncbi:MAG: hypothetical protein JXR40_06585 [Pontiellaceae bacterium]|nr:hypothetical protein [Pontiellaceae bacterium]
MSIFLRVISVLVFVFLLGACNHNANRSSNMDIEKVKPMYDYFFTWENYQSGDDPENAMYIWNGNKVGCGKSGFSIILKMLENVPEGETVYIFHKSLNKNGSAGFKIDSIPYWDSIKDMHTIKMDRDLKFNEGVIAPKGYGD